MTISPENILSLVIRGSESHDELQIVTSIRAKQEEAPIQHLCCSILVHGKEFGIQHPLFSFLRSMPTLEHVEFSSFGVEKASLDAFLDAISQNHSIHTVELFEIDCSAYAIQKLMEQKINWSLCSCQFIGHPSSCNKSTLCNVEELSIQDNDLLLLISWQESHYGLFFTSCP